MSQKQKVLDALQTFTDGVSNTTLNTICYRYSSRIHELRKEGYKIKTIKVTPTLYIFKLYE